MVSGTQVLNGAGLLIASKEKPWSERKAVPPTILTARALAEYREERTSAIAEARARMPKVTRTVPAIMRDR